MLGVGGEMKHYFLSLLAVVSVAVPVHAMDFLFSLTGGGNGIAGTISLNFLGAGGSGTGAASNVTLTSVPPGFPLPLGNVTTDWPLQMFNTFTFVNGSIVSFQFFALTGPSPYSSSIFCLNSEGQALTAYQYGNICQPKLNGVATYGREIFNEEGAQGVTFTRVETQSDVPEVATWLQMAAGFVVIGAAMRSRRRRGVSRLAIPRFPKSFKVLAPIKVSLSSRAREIRRLAYCPIEM